MLYFSVSVVTVVKNTKHIKLSAKKASLYGLRQIRLLVESQLLPKLHVSTFSFPFDISIRTVSKKFTILFLNDMFYFSDLEELCVILKKAFKI